MDGEGPGPVCPRCGSPIEPDARFCPRCGMPQGSDEGEKARQYGFYAPAPRPVVQKSSLQNARDIGRGIGAYMTLAILILVGINVGIMLWGMGLVIPEALDSITSLFLVLPWIVRVLELPGMAFVVYYVLLVIAVVLSYVAMLYLGRKQLWNELMLRPDQHSSAYMIATIFMAILTFNAAYYLLLAAMGVSYSSGGTEGSALWELLYSLVRASVWEEVICRILYIGLPLGIVYSLKGRAAPYRRYLLGGGFDFGPWEKTFLVISAAIFALAHVFSWDLYKVIPTFLAGLALGYLFLKYGVYASIMLHFFIDYLSMPMKVWPGDGTDMIMGLFLLAAMAVGAVYLVYYSIRGFELFSGKTVIRWESRGRVTDYYRPLSQAHRPYDGGLTAPSFGFMCRHCGATEARYVDGRFICSRCGREN